MAEAEQLSRRDRVIVDSGWGVKPDDQPANADEAGGQVPNVVPYDSAAADMVKRILQIQRRGFNKGSRVRVESTRTTIIDINGDALTVEGLGYGEAKLIELLKHLGAAFDPKHLGQVAPGDSDTREYDLSRVWAWGAERTG